MAVNFVVWLIDGAVTAESGAPLSSIESWFAAPDAVYVGERKNSSKLAINVLSRLFSSSSDLIILVSLLVELR